MLKYFRTLLKLFRFFFDDDFLFIGFPKEHFYYTEVKLIRQLLMKHLFEPFKVTQTLKFSSNNAFIFQKRFLWRYNKSCNPEKVMKEALSESLRKFDFTVMDLSFNNGIISSFTYTYI